MNIYRCHYIFFYNIVMLYRISLYTSFLIKPFPYHWMLRFFIFFMFRKKLWGVSLDIILMQISISFKYTRMFTLTFEDIPTSFQHTLLCNFYRPMCIHAETCRLETVSGTRLGTEQLFQ